MSNAFKLRVDSPTWLECGRSLTAGKVNNVIIVWLDLLKRPSCKPHLKVVWNVILVGFLQLLLESTRVWILGSLKSDFIVWRCWAGSILLLAECYGGHQSRTTLKMYTGLFAMRLDGTFVSKGNVSWWESCIISVATLLPPMLLPQQPIQIGLVSGDTNTIWSLANKCGQSKIWFEKQIRFAWSLFVTYWLVCAQRTLNRCLCSGLGCSCAMDSSTPTVFHVPIL